MLFVGNINCVFNYKYCLVILINDLICFILLYLLKCVIIKFIIVELILIIKIEIYVGFFLFYLLVRNLNIFIYYSYFVFKCLRMIYWRG